MNNNIINNYNNFETFPKIEQKKPKFNNLKQLKFSKNPILVSCRESFMENRRNFYGRFYVGPLEMGQGITIANALRRVLLSELKGLAITSVEIEGVSHEYSSIPGVRESVLDILLNLKQIILKTKIQLKRPQIAYIHCKGPGVLRAGDILLPSFIQCVDPEQYITTLSYNGLLKMKLVIRQGKNYLIQKPTIVVSDLSPSFTQKLNYPTFSMKFNSPKKNLKLKKNEISVKENGLALGNTNLVSLELVKLFFKNKKFTRTKLEKILIKDDFKKLESIRSIRKIFKNSRNKDWFIFLLKKHIISLIDDNSKSNLNPVSSNFKISEKNKPSFIKNSSITKSLAVDSIFMPVTRVNYILEENSQKLFDEYIQNNFLKNIIESSNETDLSNFDSKIISKNLNLFVSDSKLEFKNESFNIYKEIKKNNFKNYWSFFRDESSKDNRNFSSILQSTDYFEKFNKSPKEIIILEIWTNGSILPRIALSDATKQLLSLFYRFKKAKMMQSNFFKTNINYNLILENLNRHYDYSQYNIINKLTNTF